MNIRQLINWQNTAIKSELCKAFPDAASKQKIDAAFKTASKEWINAEVPAVLPVRQAQHVQRVLKRDALGR
jgi:hypothetical protein